MSNRDLINVIKREIDLADLTREHGILLNGENKALCPFHEEQQPSFHLHTDGEEQYFYCFGCGAGGDAIQFVKLMQRLSFKESLSFLAKRAGIPMDESKLDAAVEHDRCLSDVLAATAGFYQSCLTSDARQYLHDGRGFSDDIIRDFQIGFARGGLREHLAQHYPEDLCLEAGVLKKHDNGMARDFLYNRIVFPHLFRGRVVNLTGRAMGNASGPKYLHLPGKQRHLFNEDAIVKGKKEVFLTEGIPDCLSMVLLDFTRIMFQSLLPATRFTWCSMPTRRAAGVPEKLGNFLATRRGSCPLAQELYEDLRLPATN